MGAAIGFIIIDASVTGIHIYNPPSRHTHTFSTQSSPKINTRDRQDDPEILRPFRAQENCLWVLYTATRTITAVSAEHCQVRDLLQDGPSQPELTVGKIREVDNCSYEFSEAPVKT